MKQNFFQNCTLRFTYNFGGVGVLFKNNSYHYYFRVFISICQNKALKKIQGDSENFKKDKTGRSVWQLEKSTNSPQVYRRNSKNHKALIRTWLF